MGLSNEIKSNSVEARASSFLRAGAKLGDSLDYDSHFRKLAMRLSELGRAENVSIAPYRSDSLNYFSALPEATKKDVTSSLSDYVQICEETTASGHSLRGSLQLTWNALKKFNLRPHAGLLDYIEPNQVVEFYNSSNIQIFRNFVFFELCSYTVEDLYCRPWFELYKRDDQITQDILAEFHLIFSGQCSDPLPSRTPRHNLIEVNSLFGHVVNMKVNFCAPLYSMNDGERFLIVTESCNIVSANTEIQNNTQPNLVLKSQNNNSGLYVIK